MAKTLFTEMPSDCAPLAERVARMARPYFEKRKTMPSPPSSPARPRDSSDRRFGPAAEDIHVLGVEDARERLEIDADIHFISAENTVDSAIVTMITEMIARDHRAQDHDLDAMPNRNMKIRVSACPDRTAPDTL